MNNGDFTLTELGMIAAGLNSHAKILARAAKSRKWAGPAFTAKRAELRRLSGKYTALAITFEKEMAS